ncbi:hypothetical protein TYRP_017076 [Tyrophagus putrescentiae]|nr:hypothetical protein TYRP_017076 [Tyrophagus putrescentiae]
MRSLLWAIFRPYYLDVLQTYLAIANTPRAEEKDNNTVVQKSYTFRISLARWSICGTWHGNAEKRPSALAEHDITFHFFLYFTGLRQPLLVLTTAPIPLFACVFHHVVYYHPDPAIWTELYCALVLNSQRYTARYFTGGRVWQGTAVLGSVESALKVLYSVNWRHFLNRKQLPSNNDDRLTLTNLHLYYQAVFYGSCAACCQLVAPAGGGAEGARALVRHDVFVQLGLAYTRLSRPGLLYVLLVLNSRRYISRYFAGGRVWQGSLGSSVKSALKVLYTVNWRYFWHRRRRLPPSTDDLLALTNIYLFYQTVFYYVGVLLHLYFLVGIAPLLPVKEPLKLVLICVDLSVGLIIELYILKSGIFITLTGGLFPHVAISEYRALNAILKQNNNNHNNNPKNHNRKAEMPSKEVISSNRSHYLLQQTISLLAAFRQRHTATTLSLLNYSRKIVSDCCAAYFIFNLPYNCNALLYLCFPEGGGAEKMYLFVLSTFVCETFVPLNAIFNYIAANEAIVSSVPHLLTSYLKISQAKRAPGCLFIESWKTASYIELLHRSTGHLELKAGQLGAFRRENALQFVGVYAAFIMYFYGNFVI